MSHPIQISVYNKINEQKLKKLLLDLGDVQEYIYNEIKSCMATPCNEEDWKYCCGDSFARISTLQDRKLYICFYERYYNCAGAIVIKKSPVDRFSTRRIEWMYKGETPPREFGKLREGIKLQLFKSTI